MSPGGLRTLPEAAYQIGVVLQTMAVQVSLSTHETPCGYAMMDGRVIPMTPRRLACQNVLP